MIHETAIIDKGAALGANVRVGPYTCIGADVRIGDDCVIGPRVTILPHTALGPRCEVHAGAVLGDVPQDTAFEACRSHVRIGAGCVLREGVTIHRGTEPESVTEVGDGCWLMGFSHVAHNCRLAPGVIVANGALLAGYVSVGERAFISGNCVIHQFCRVGRLAMLGGGCAVSKDVPPFCLLSPVTLNGLAGLNVVGMRRAGLSPEERRAVKKAFTILFRSGKNVPEALACIRDALPSPLAAELCDFVEASKRGICTWGRDE